MTKLKLVIISASVLIVLVATYFIWPSDKKTVNDPPTSSDQVTETEKTKIDTWISRENLNEFGDPKDTTYLGGTPLFDERTGKYIDRYDYILSQHPDRPWAN